MADLTLNVHDIRVAESSIFNPNGTTSKVTTVTFFVGDHGPFTLTYNATEATAARIKADVQAQVDKLLSVHELGI